MKFSPSFCCFVTSCLYVQITYLALHSQTTTSVTATNINKLYIYIKKIKPSCWFKYNDNQSYLKMGIQLCPNMSSILNISQTVYNVQHCGVV